MLDNLNFARVHGLPENDTPADWKSCFKQNTVRQPRIDFELFFCCSQRLLSEPISKPRLVLGTVGLEDCTCRPVSCSLGVVDTGGFGILEASMGVTGQVNVPVQHFSVYLLGH